jgi:aldehyde:ferredoxin oxidoreductase
MYGRGDLLRIDLSSRKVSREIVSPELHRRFLGGGGINTWLLWEHFLHIDPKIDPLSPDNVLIVGVGPLASTGLGAGSKMKFTYKSPAYNLYGDTSSGGRFSSQLRWAGHDHMIITGRSEHPVYIWISDDLVEIRDARYLWGRDVFQTDALIKAELGDEDVETACIGQAGENLVRFASIMVSGHRAGGRGGGGCVFGSKNLKAIAVRGTKGFPIYDPQALFGVAREFREYKEREPGAGYHLRYGTIDIMRDSHLPGGLAYRNHQGRLTPSEKLAKLDHAWYAKNIGVRSMACSPGCGFACGGWYHLKGNESPGARRHAGEWGTKPEFGAVNPFGTGCDLPDLPEVCHLNRMCNAYGMDVMETSMSIAFFMELRERGIITQKDTVQWTGKPLSLEWGNSEAMEEIVEAIALRKNELGEILSGGVYRAGLRIEEAKKVPALKYAVYGKAGATHEGAARATGLGFACAVASVGAHHMKGTGISPSVSQEFLGRPDAGDSFSLMTRGKAAEVEGSPRYALKGAGHALSETFKVIVDALGVCHFLCSHGSLDTIPLDILATALWAITGVRLSREDLLIAGERVVNLEKAFNSRLGLRREDDTVCHRWLHEPLLEGLARGRKMDDYLEPVKDEYYEYHGWDRETSLQTEKKLRELDMLDVAQVLLQEGALAGVGGKSVGVR